MEAGDLSSLDNAELVQMGHRAKENIERNQKLLLDIEKALLDKNKDLIKEKGTTNLDCGIKIVTGFTEGWEQQKLHEIYSGGNWPLWPFKGEWKPDNKSLKVLEESFPQHYHRLCEALTMKPKKPAFNWSAKNV
jgi:hypothetical protein